MRVPTLRTTLSLLFLVAFFYLGMEWLFFATKASFLDSFEPVEVVGCLLIPPTVLTVVVLPLVLLFAVADRCLPRLRSRLWPAAFLLASSLLLLIDNFTFTVFGRGIITTGRLSRFGYLVLFLVLCCQCFRWLSTVARGWDRLGARHVVNALPLSILTAAVLMVGLEIGRSDLSEASIELRPLGDEIQRPNVILLSTDGLEARAMSVYGLDLPTTPFLEEFSRGALVFENAFPPAGKTTGTLVSMLTGALPSERQVGFPPQILPKRHAARHLPAMLQKLGYKGYQRTIRYYADAGDLNFVSSFNQVNGRQLWTPLPGSPGGTFSYLFSPELQFLRRMSKRLTERLLHIIALRPIVDHHALVTDSGEVGWGMDQKSIEEALEFVREQEGPFFLQLHLLGTHCCEHLGARKWFSEAQASAFTTRPRKMARYFDSVRDADEQFRFLLGYLDELGQLENSIVIITSDHSRHWDSIERIPLIVRFPGEVHRGSISRNVSLAQVPATILAHMGLDRPAWMTQQSLLEEPEPRSQLEAALTIDGHPPILGLATFDYSRFKVGAGGLSRINDPGPPLFGVKEVSLILADRWVKLNLRSGKMESGPVRRHTSPVTTAQPPPDTAIQEYIEQCLADSGFTLP